MLRPYIYVVGFIKVDALIDVVGLVRQPLYV